MDLSDNQLNDLSQDIFRNNTHMGWLRAKNKQIYIVYTVKCNDIVTDNGNDILNNK